MLHVIHHPAAQRAALERDTLDVRSRQGEGDRIAKLLARAGIASRREADEWIAKGWVRVDGQVVSELGSKVLPHQKISIEKQAQAQQAQRVTVLLNKPMGYVSGQAEDGYQPAFTLVRPENRWAEDTSPLQFSAAQLKSLVPAGRLDIDSVGLLILTQDGRIAKQLIGEDTSIEKEYLVRVEGALDDEGLKLLQHPAMLGASGFMLFAEFFADLSTIVPPFTLIGAARRGPAALAINVAVAVGLCAFAWIMIKLTGNLPQWSAVALGYYAVFSWASVLRQKDPATFRLIWGTPAFICTTLGYSMVSLAAYGLAFWSAPYAEQVLKLPKDQLAFWLGANGAVGGFAGVIIGGRVADMLRAKNPAGRILVILFGVVAPAVPIWIGYTTPDPVLFYVMNFLAGLFGAAALGAAAATTQDLVLPRMRGTATASFFLGTTLVGLCFGPYMVGQVSDLAGTMVDGKQVGDLRTGILSLIAVAPIAVGLLVYAYRAVPQAEATLAERAGESA